MRPTYRDFIADDGQFDCEVAGYEIGAGPSPADCMQALAAMNRARRPLPERETIALLARLRAMTKSRAEAEDDVKMSLKVYALECAQFAGVVVNHVLRSQPAHGKFWPAWEELLLRLEHHQRRFDKRRDALVRAVSWGSRRATA